MKGSNELHLNEQQMCEVLNDWWQRSTYSPLSASVVGVCYNSTTGLFIVDLKEPKAASSKVQSSKP